MAILLVMCKAWLHGKLWAQAWFDQARQGQSHGLTLTGGSESQNRWLKPQLLNQFLGSQRVYSGLNNSDFGIISRSMHGHSQLTPLHVLCTCNTTYADFCLVLILSWILTFAWHSYHGQLLSFNGLAYLSGLDAFSTTEPSLTELLLWLVCLSCVAVLTFWHNFIHKFTKWKIRHLTNLVGLSKSEVV